MGFFTRIKNLFSRKRVVGLALGSGGAKGMAHLGALKAFEEEGIRFQVVAGSSIGSIVGALYAKGFSADDMIQVVEGFNRKEFSKNLRPFADLGFAEEFLSRYLDGDIRELPIPFAAWVTDGETNGGEMLSEGKTARALIASSAIPPFFRGVEIGEKRYYDGVFQRGSRRGMPRARGGRRHRHRSVRLCQGGRGQEPRFAHIRRGDRKNFSRQIQCGLQEPRL